MRPSLDLGVEANESPEETRGATYEAAWDVLHLLLRSIFPCERS